MKLDDTLPGYMTGRLTDNALVIFLFHGVIRKQKSAVRNYTGKHIEADLFRKCISALSTMGQALSMDQLLQHCEQQKPFPPNSFAITFDDGFENNISIAAPILEDFNVPSTIYVTSGFVEHNGMSWIDRIEYAVASAENQILKVNWSSDDYILEDAESRIAFLKAVRKYVKGTPSCDANGFADEVCARLGKPGKLSSDDELDLKMSWEQVKTANESDLITIGGHSHVHEILSFLTPEKLVSEIDSSLDMIYNKAGVLPTHYSYPEGLEHCYSPEVIAVLKERGVKCCPTAIDGENTQYADPFHLRRVMINAD